MLHVHKTCGRISRAYDVLLILNYLAFSGRFVCGIGWVRADLGLAFTILGVYGVWGPRWTPLLIVVPLTLVKPAVLIVRAFNGSNLDGSLNGVTV